MATAPEITIVASTGDIHIPEQNLNWEFIRGTFPFCTSISLPYDLARKLLIDVSNPISLRIKYWLYEGHAEVLEDRLIENLYIIDHVVIDKTEIHIRIADKRWLFTGVKVTCAYNVTYAMNQKLSAIPETFTPSELRRPFETISSGRYASWSIKTNNKPYTVGEIIQEISTQHNISISKMFLDSYDYIAENIIFNNADLTTVLDQLLRIGGLSLGIKPNGNLYIFSLYSYLDDLNHNYLEDLEKKKLIAGNLFWQDKRLGRPEAIRVNFEKISEVAIMAVEELGDWSIYNNAPLPIPIEPPSTLKGKIYQAAVLSSETSWDNGIRKCIGCVNVLPCPFYMNVNGRNINVGEWVTFKDFFSALGIPKYIDFICQSGFFGNTLEIRILYTLMALSGSVNPTLALRRKSIIIASLVRNHFRLTYMLDPYYRQHIKEIKAEKVSIINTFDQKHSPSPVIIDYCLVGSVRIPFLKNVVEAGEYLKSSINFDANQVDFPFNYDITEASNSSSPFFVSVADNAVFVFKLSPVIPIETEAAQIFPYMVAPYAPFPAAYEYPCLSFCYPAKTHTMVTFLSIVWNTALPETSGQPEYSNRRFYPFFISPNCTVLPPDYPIGVNPLAKFHEIEIRSTKEIARFPFPCYDRIAENEGILLAIAYYEAGKIYNIYKNRCCGTITYSNLDEDIRLVGNIQFIRWNISLSGSGFTTTVNLYENIPMPEIETQLNQKQIDYLNSHTDRNNTYDPSIKVY